MSWASLARDFKAQLRCEGASQPSQPNSRAGSVRKAAPRTTAERGQSRRRQRACPFCCWVDESVDLRVFRRGECAFFVVRDAREFAMSELLLRSTGPDLACLHLAS